jgi:hypothetical protein
MKYELNFSVKDDDLKIKSFTTLKGDDLVQLLAQFPLLISMVIRDLHAQEEVLKLRTEGVIIDDDIPF